MNIQKFKKFLSEKGIASKNIPYYINWISKFFSFYEKPVIDKIDNKIKEKFLKSLTFKYQDWQINQADYAIKLFKLKSPIDTLFNRFSFIYFNFIGF